ncbi:Golgi-associated RAB2 interactor protein 6-like isoform X1 [Pogona vitticeps]
MATMLQKHLAREYPSFQNLAMYEGRFVQVTKKGKPVDLHNKATEAIIGIASDDMKLPLPNMMFIARPVVKRLSCGPPKEELILTRLIPLRSVRLSIHDREKQIIKIHLINGQSYYLMLHPCTEERDEEFERWRKLIHLLCHPPACNVQPRPVSLTEIDNVSIHVPSSDDETEELQSFKEKKEETNHVQKKKEKNHQEQAYKGSKTAQEQQVDGKNGVAVKRLEYQWGGPLKKSARISDFRAAWKTRRRPFGSKTTLSSKER